MSNIVISELLHYASNFGHINGSLKANRWNIAVVQEIISFIDLELR